MLADLVRDFRYSARSLARTPSFTVVAVAVLALGIGATSAIFSLVSAVWLKPLPFADEDRLVSLWVDLTPIGGPSRVEISPANYVDWQMRAQSFESMAPIVPSSFNLTGDGGEPERLAGVRTGVELIHDDRPCAAARPHVRARRRRPASPSPSSAKDSGYVALVATPRPSAARSH